MGNRLGIIASSGEIPSFIQEKAAEKGYMCVVAAIEGQAIRSALEDVELIQWFNVGDIQEVVLYFKTNGVSEVIFAGKIDPRVIYDKTQFDLDALSILNSGKDKTPTSVIEKVISFFEKHGLTVIDPTPFLLSYFCEKGTLTFTRPSKEMELDIAFGWDIARTIADSDIGQTVVVKDRTIVAVEGIEGTDEAIKRGGRLAGAGTTVVKVSRRSQDPRIDLPAVGLVTIQSLVEAKSSVLCFEAGKMPFFQRQEAVPLADLHGIAIITK
jgi:DUF1009 family protein